MGALIVPSKLLVAITSKAASSIGSGVSVLPTGALGESIVRVSAPEIVSLNCLPRSTIPIMPGDSSCVAPPSSVATWTEPSVTWIAAPVSETVMLNVVPLTTAARYGVSTPKCGVAFLSIRNIALPTSWKNCITPPSALGSDIRTRLLGDTATYSSPRTSTARLFAPAATMSPGCRMLPVTAIFDTPARKTLTLPALSDRVHCGVPALAAPAVKNAAIARVLVRICITISLASRKALVALGSLLDAPPSHSRLL